MEGEIALQHNIIVELVPVTQCCKLRSWKTSKRTQVEAINRQTEQVDNP
jgi:hypothetical protein